MLNLPHVDQQTLGSLDKLEESEIARLEEKKEQEYKPVVMGEYVP